MLRHCYFYILSTLCSSIFPLQKGLVLLGGWGGSGRTKILKKCRKLNWNFQRGGKVLQRIPSVWGGGGGIQLFSRTSPFSF